MESLVIIAHTVYKYSEYLANARNKNSRVDFFSPQAQEIWDPLREARNEYPELLQITISHTNLEGNSYYDVLTAEDVEKIKHNALGRYSFSLLPTAESFSDVVEIGDSSSLETVNIKTPVFVRPGNIAIYYTCGDLDNAIDSLNTLIFNMSLALPPGKVKFTFVDLNINKVLEEIVSALPSNIVCHIRNGSELHKFFYNLQKKVDSLMKISTNIIDYNNEKKKIQQPYEVVVLTDGIAKYKEYQERINALMNIGSKGGLFFIILSQKNEEIIYPIDSSLDVKEIYEADSIQTPIVNHNPYWFNEINREKCLTYMRNELVNKQNKKAIHWDENLEDGYTKLENEIYVPVGDSMSFHMNNVNHVHAFIVGQSGSGKSVFLHNIIGSVIHKYAPEDLQLYLMDFKLGGVEFNRYKGVKHVKAMLVDNSDQQITLEILRELRNSMVERGKLLRNAGVTNIEEYNHARTSDKMAHILLVADECHEMFRVGDSIPRTISNEIAEIITKIAKEGRSQGVHLILATQTLSGAEISNEILHNISDHYLLKCAPTDSERLVPGSSDITSSQTTGEIYYHHVEEQMQFKAFYTPKEEAEKLVAAAAKKAEGHHSNGEFYFSGAQLFHLNDCKMEENRRIRKNPVAFLGKSIDLNQKDIAVNLKEDFSENILVFGLNDDQMLTRTSYVLMLSTMLAIKKGGLDIPVKVINCLNDEESIYEDILEELSDAGLCDVISRRERGSFLKQLAESVKSEKAGPMLLFILGQERFRELKMDMEIGNNENASASDSDFSSLLGAFSSSADAGVQTFKQAIDIILEHGPEIGVHTIIQVDKPTNLLFEDMTAKEIFKKFKHLIMLKSDEMTASRLNLRDDIRLETLSKDPERLRAYYYAEESDSYTLFTPYMLPDVNNILELINNA